MAIRFPDIPHRLGLGVGLDLHWGDAMGFQLDSRGRDIIAPGVVQFLQAHRDRFAYLFVSWQPRNRNHLDPTEYYAAYDDLFRRVPPWSYRALHHTALNLGAMEPYERTDLLELTNALIRRYGLSWVNEDLGLWSLNGKPLPYPLPPFLTDAGLRASIANTRQVQEGLEAPLLVEFPGFSEGASILVGRWHAYDFFRCLAEETGAAVTLDLGHLLSYQWLRGARGEDLYDHLERLPLEHCFEIHLSGCAIVADRFLDVHHGILLDEQLDLLQRIAPLCPNLRGITYEDPKFKNGALIPRSVPNFHRLEQRVRRWAA